MIQGFHAGKPAFQHDEATRSASLAATTPMLAAKEMGFDIGPMIGINPDAVARLVHLDEHQIPVMPIVIGQQAGDLRPSLKPAATRWRTPTPPAGRAPLVRILPQIRADG